MAEEWIFQPTRPLRGATLDSTRRCAFGRISTHAPLAGRDAVDLLDYTIQRVFQPTRPLRGATILPNRGGGDDQNFNPRAPCGARRNVDDHRGSYQDFNPRAPCGARPRSRRTVSPVTIFQPTRPLRGATPFLQFAPLPFLFQPTRPLRGATNTPADVYVINRISTHAPLAGRDGTPSASRTTSMDFNPRAPCGARPRCPLCCVSKWRFQPTRPLRGATAQTLTPVSAAIVFQPTRPLRGATMTVLPMIAASTNFNPRAPCGARPRLHCLLGKL